MQAIEILQNDHNFRSFSQVIPNFQYLLNVLKYPFSAKYDLLRDSSYRDMDFGLFSNQFTAFALSGLFSADKQVVKFVNQTIIYNIPDLSAFTAEYRQSGGDWADLTGGVAVGAELRLSAVTTHPGHCSDYQFSLGGNPAVLANQSLQAGGGVCVYLGRIPLKSGIYEIQSSSFGSGISAPGVRFTAEETAAKGVSLVSVKPMIIRVNQNFSVRVQMVDLYGNELEASQASCAQLVGQMLLADQRFSNNPYIEEMKSYDDLTGSPIQVAGADYFDFQLVNQRYCVFNMTEGYPVSRILFVKLFERGALDRELQLAPDVREGLLIPICEYPAPRYAIGALGAVKIVLAIIVAALTLVIIPYLAYRCVNPRVPELVRSNSGGPYVEAGDQQGAEIQVASAAPLIDGKIPQQMTSNLLPSNSISEKGIQGLGEIKLRGEPVYKQLVKEVDFPQLQLNPEQLAIFDSLEPVLKIGSCWRGQVVIDKSQAVTWRNFFFFGERSVFVAVFDAVQHAESYYLQLLLQSKMRIRQLRLLEASVLSTLQLDSQITSAMRKLGSCAVVCIYEQSSDAISFGNADQCAILREQLDKLSKMRPTRAFGNVKNGIFRTIDGNVLLGPSSWFGFEYLTSGCNASACAQDLRDLDDMFRLE